MTLDDKRKVIEVLMCAGDVGQMIAVAGTGPLFHRCAVFHRDVASEHVEHHYAFSAGYKALCVEAAYRLIESSPTLRQEWFGAQ